MAGRLAGSQVAEGRCELLERIPVNAAEEELAGSKKHIGTAAHEQPAGSTQHISAAAHSRSQLKAESTRIRQPCVVHWS